MGVRLLGRNRSRERGHWGERGWRKCWMWDGRRIGMLGHHIEFEGCVRFLGA